MPGINRLHLEDAYEDSPQTRNLVGVFRKDADILKDYTSKLNQCCTRLLLAQREITAATQSLSQHLKVYDQHRFPLEPEGSILSETLKQFTQYFDELSSSHQILATQLEDGVFPLQKFIQADLEEVSRVGSMYDMSTTDLEESMGKYMKLSKKKDNEKARVEVASDVSAMRKKFHQTSLHYFSALNALQYKRKTAMLDPLIAIMHAQRGFFELGRETIAKPEVEQFLSNISSSVHGVRIEQTEETNRTVELMDAIEQNSVHLYPIEPQPDMPYRAASNTLTQKGGYLYLRSKANILNTKWERFYFFIQGGNLMSQGKNEVAGSLVLDLNEEGVLAEPIDCDDRRNVFQVICVGSKRSIILQAENQAERDEWIATINNAAREGGYVKGEDSAGGAAARAQQAPAKVSFNMPVSKDANKQNKNSLPTTPPSTPQESNFQFDAPIQFDIITPNNEERFVMAKGGPPKRINPFDHSSEKLVGEQGGEDQSFSQTYVVRFLGSMEVKTDRGEKLILDTIQQVMAARAIHNVFKTTESHLVVSIAFLRLLDPSNNTIRIQFPLEDISFWASHVENKKLLGFISRSRGATERDKPKYTCHVFESNVSAEEICHAITNATKMAYQALIDKKEQVKQEEKNILLANINQLDDLDDSLEEEAVESENQLERSRKSVKFAEDEQENGVAAEAHGINMSTPPLSPDGKFMLLDGAGGGADTEHEMVDDSAKSPVIAHKLAEEEDEPESEA